MPFVSILTLYFFWFDWISFGVIDHLKPHLFFVHCRWNRLENLLVQGRKDKDFTAKEALQPVLKLLLGPDGEELRNLVIKEAVRVTEAFVLGTFIDTYNSIPDLMRTLMFNGNATGPLMMSNTERESMIELRDQVLRIWILLRSSESFDPALLQPILQVGTIVCRMIVFYFFILCSFGWI